MVVAAHLGLGQRPVEVRLGGREERGQPGVQSLLEQVPGEVEVDLSQIAVGVEDPGNDEAGQAPRATQGSAWVSRATSSSGNPRSSQSRGVVTSR